jgi:prostaglandin-endoperoxide synthase 2
MQILIKVLSFFPAAVAWLNRFIINFFASRTPPRPHRFSLWSPSRPSTPAPLKTPAAVSNVAPKSDPPSPPACYTTWPSLFDRTFTARHLPPLDASVRPVLPDENAVLDLFRRSGPMQKNPRSSVLFCFFAQWFTDSFLRTNPLDPRRNTSNHEIDLCQIYGLDEQSTWALRTGQGGRLKSRLVNGCEYPALLFKNGQIDRQFYDPDPVNERGLTYLRGGRDGPWKAALEDALKGTISDPARRDYIYASGLDRGSSTVAYSAFNTIFLREHNRIAGVLAAAYPTWDDDRLFETARLVNLRQVLNVVVNDYIRHIAGVFPFSLDRTFAERKDWYRTNRISIEFNLLYRWHSLVPDAFTMAGKTLGDTEFRYNNALLEAYGVEQLITDASSQYAGRVGLHNTPGFLAVAEQHGLKWARDFGLQPFNRYRERFGLAPYRSIDELADSDAIAAELKRIYNDDVDAVEFTVGLFGEKRGEKECMPETLIRMVAYDAFTHILTNPVLSTEVHCPLTYSEAGWDIVQQNSTFEEIVKRNSDPNKPLRVSLSAV